MIEFKSETPDGRYPIQAYKPNEVIINNTSFQRSVIVSAQTLIDNWQPQTIQELIASDWESVIALEPKIILLGTGTKLIFPSMEVLAPLMQNKIGFEIMDTAAACRTYTILMAEDRHVVAALLLS